jgi:hypothetical protein
MNHKAIYALYSNVVSVDDTAGAMDANGNSVTIDMDAVNAWVDPEQYAIDRASAYPSIQEQLDMQYWDSVNGTTTWKDAIEAVKTENPKP